MAEDDAAWRSQRLTTEQFLQRQVEQGRRISPIFSVPGMEIYIFRVDWLHAVDQGVAADFIGNTFESLLHKLPGRGKDERAHALSSRLWEYHKKPGSTDDGLKELTKKSFQRPSKTQPAKMKGSAAQIRGLGAIC